MRGQISLDFILAITIALVAAGTILAVSGQIAQTQAEAGIRQQLDGIGNGLAAIISNSAMLNDAEAGDASIDYKIPALLVPGKANPEKCTIGINRGNGTIALSYSLIELETGTETTVSVTKHFVNPVGMDVPLSAECGGSIFKITKAR